MNLSPEKVLLLLVIALVVLGPNRLPQAARTLGRVVGNLRRLSGSLQGEVRDALAEHRQAIHGAVGDLGLGEVRNSLREMASPLTPPRPGPAGASTAAAGGPGTAGPPAVGADAIPGGAPAAPPPDDPSLN